MIYFLYFGALSSIFLLFILFAIENIRFRIKRIRKEQRYSQSLRRLAPKLIFSSLVAFFISMVLPFLVWTFGEKEVEPLDKVKNTKDIYSFSDLKSYVKIKTVKDKTQYIVNLGVGNAEEALDKSSVEIVTLPDGQHPRYETIVHYKKVRLKAKNKITVGVNNFYCFGEDWRELPLSESIKLYVPSGTLNEDP